MSIQTDVQKLEPGALVSGFILDGTALGAGILRFHGETYAGHIYWQGQTYYKWPVEASGFAQQTDRQPRPKLKVANLDRSISTLCHMFDDFIGAKVIRWTTLARYLDAANYGGSNPTADPGEHFPDEIWYVDRVADEMEEYVEFELATAFDLNGVKVPRRQVIADRCLWITIGGYRGPYCGYAGPPVATINDTPTSDPALDRCSGCVTGCELRFGVNNPLPYGGVPGAGLVRM